MNLKENLRELSVILLAIIILSLTVSFQKTNFLFTAMIIFAVVIPLNILTKKIVGYFLEAEVKTRFWSIYQFGFRKDAHFKNPVPMAWLPLIFSLLTRGFIWWLAILEFDVNPRTERVSKRHGLYRFTEMTDWHIAAIAGWGIVITLISSIIGYLLGFEMFSRLSIYFAAWSILPLGSLDGSKIFYGSRGMWITLSTITLLLLGWSLLIV